PSSSVGCSDSPPPELHPRTRLTDPTYTFSFFRSSTYISRTSFSLLVKTQARSPVKIRPSNPLQRRPEFADILHVFESQHFVDQGRATCRSQDRRDEVVRFRNNLLARQGILRRAPQDRK